VTDAGEHRLLRILITGAGTTWWRNWAKQPRMV